MGRKTGVSVGVGVINGVDVAIGATVGVGITVVSPAGVIFGVTRRRERGGGLIGRTGSKYWVWPSSTRVALLVSVAAGAACVVSFGCAVTDGDGASEAIGVSIGDIGVALGDSASVGETVAVG